MDAEHIVLLMQENRSFDHTYGTLQGVRGFNDPRAITIPRNNLVWLQPNKKAETYAPFRFDIKGTKITWMDSLPHSWSNQVDARNNGKYNGWLDNKHSGNDDYKSMPLTMGYYTRADIPFIIRWRMHLQFAIRVFVLRLPAQLRTVCFSGQEPFAKNRMRMHRPTCGMKMLII